MKCYICKEERDTSMFYKDSSKKNGVSSRCKMCERKRKRPHKQNLSPELSEEEILEYKKLQERRKVRKCISNSKRNSSKRKKYNISPEKALWKSAKSRAKEENIPFSIEISDINIPTKCPILEIPMVVGTWYAPSIDRIDGDKGYVKENILVISRRANTMKNNANKNDIEMFCKNVYKIMPSK